MANEEYQIPIFLINGQLDSGKTRFISDTIAMGQFADAKNKLLIVCEEGEEEYSEKLLKDNGVDMVVVEKEDFNIKTLNELDKKYDPWIVIVEYNGMWDNTKFVDEICIDQWQVVQILTTISAETFDLYYNNMRGQFVYHVTGSDLVIVNRCDENTKKYPIRGSIKSLNPMCQIVYENKNIKINNEIVCKMTVSNDMELNVTQDISSYIKRNKKNNIVFQFDGIRKPKQNDVDIREFSALISEIQFY